MVHFDFTPADSSLSVRGFFMFLVVCLRIVRI
jgi:hypothetical protein